MKQKAINLTSVALAVAFALASVFTPPAAMSESSNQFPKTRQGAHENLEFFGAKVLRINSTASATHLVDGEGLLESICPLGGVSGQYAIAYDTTHNTAQGEPVAVLDDNFTLAISPKVYTVLDTAAIQGDPYKGCWFPRVPMKFVTGLYGKNSNASGSFLYSVSCTSGANPCVPATP